MKNRVNLSKTNYPKHFEPGSRIYDPLIAESETLPVTKCSYTGNH